MDCRESSVKCGRAAPRTADLCAHLVRRRHPSQGSACHYPHGSGGHLGGFWRPHQLPLPLSLLSLPCSMSHLNPSRALPGQKLQRCPPWPGWLETSFLSNVSTHFESVSPLTSPSFYKPDASLACSHRAGVSPSSTTWRNSRRTKDGCLRKTPEQTHWCHTLRIWVNSSFIRILIFHLFFWI